MLKNAVRGIFQLASARYMPAPGSVNEHCALDSRRGILPRTASAG
jgi:hypothetical protein